MGGKRIRRYYRVPKDELTLKERKMVKEKLTIDPPKYGNQLYDKGKESFPVYRKDSDHLYLPIPYGLKKFGWEDVTRAWSTGERIDVSFDGTLDPDRNQPTTFQKTFTKGFQGDKSHGGLLWSAVGSGKTVMSMKLIADVSRTAAFVVHQDFLGNQAKETAQQFLPDADIGWVQQDRCDYQGKDIVIVVAQSLLAGTDKYPDDLFDYFGLVIFDECVHAEEKVLTGNGYKEAEMVYEQLESGESVQVQVQTPEGFQTEEITDWWEHQKEQSFEITTTQNKGIRVSPDHEFRIIRPSGGMEWVEASDLMEGDCLARPTRPLDSFTWSAEGYFMGLFVGDGHYLGGGDWPIRFGVSNDIESWETQILRVADHYNADMKRTDTERGDVLFYLSSELEEIVRNFGFTPGKKTGGVPEIDLLEHGKDWAFSFIQGLLDAEGSSNSGLFRLDITEESIIEEVGRVLRLYGFELKQAVNEKDDYRDCHYLELTRRSSKRFSEQVGFGFDRKNNSQESEIERSGARISEWAREIREVISFSVLANNGSFSHKKLKSAVEQDLQFSNSFIREIVKALQKIVDSVTVNDCKSTPYFVALSEVAEKAGVGISTVHRKPDEFDSEWKSLLNQKKEHLQSLIDRVSWVTGYRPEKVTGITQQSGGTFYDFEVPNHHRFICEGVEVHNCHNYKAKTFSQVWPQFTARWKLGMSATMTKSDDTDRVYRLFGGDVLAKNDEYPLTPKVFRVFTNTRLNSSNYQLRGGGTNVQGMKTDLAKVTDRNEQILDQIEKAHGAGRRILALTPRRDHVDHLVNKLQARGINASPFVGGMSREDREAAKRHQVLVGTNAIAEEGLDIPEADTLVLTMGCSSLRQVVGRILRPHEDKKEPLVVDFVDTFKPFEKKANWRKRQYINEGFDVRNVT